MKTLSNGLLQPNPTEQRLINSIRTEEHLVKAGNRLLRSELLILKMTKEETDHLKSLVEDSNYMDALIHDLERMRIDNSSIYFKAMIVEEDTLAQITG